MVRHLSKPFRLAELAALLDDIAGAHACSAASTVAGVDDFDRATWAELRELFGSDGVLCLRDTLVADLPTQRARLAEALRDHDLAAFKRLAHTLRGVSLQLGANALAAQRSEEHTSELQSLMRISYAVFCLKKKTQTT